MNDENLEARLRQLPTPELPESWRDEILANAQRAADVPERSGQFWSRLLSDLRAVFARNPFTSGALAALWLVVFLLRLCTPAEPSTGAVFVQVDPARSVYLSSLQEELRIALLEQSGAIPSRRQ